MVKNTWVWTTNEANPGEMRPSIAKYKTPNWPRPTATPYAHKLAQDTFGLGMKNMRGSKAKT